ncbi:hypothetical protein EAT49_18555 [Histidinibacterium lentulum]|uniref:Uncharacterized protein n=1 Tax=Histidinibacterium lentulum TaxID=2480588 RepID=A0A3N2QRH0_9RHOB|nr:hypothetical protein EAT49_18555 [Histidinibacterium lentulum]
MSDQEIGRSLASLRRMPLIRNHCLPIGQSILLARSGSACTSPVKRFSRRVTSGYFRISSVEDSR